MRETRDGRITHLEAYAVVLAAPAIVPVAMNGAFGANATVAHRFTTSHTGAAPSWRRRGPRHPRLMRRYLKAAAFQNGERANPRNYAIHAGSGPDGSCKRRPPMKERFPIFRPGSTPGRSLLPGVCAKACAREVHERARTVTVKREAMNFSAASRRRRPRVCHLRGAFFLPPSPTNSRATRPTLTPVLSDAGRRGRRLRRRARRGLGAQA